MTGEVEKEGFDTGRRAINPFTDEPVPIWVANFVLVEYGTGAVMAVPAHDERDFEFARKYQLPIRVVVRPADGAAATPETMTEAVSNDGVLVQSGRYDGMPSDAAREALTADAEQARDRRGHGAVPAEGLGHLAPALLGHADPGALLREVRDGAGALRRLSRWSCRRSPSSPAAAIRRWRRCRSS